MSKFTAALNVLNTDWHVTLCFDDCRKAAKSRTTNEVGDLKVLDVVYWKHCDLTVALVKSDLCDTRNAYWEGQGYQSDLGYNPHFTLGKGNLVADNQALIGKTFQVGEEYIRVF